MQATKENISHTKVRLTISVEPSELENIKDTVTSRLGRDVRISGFRAGKAPKALVEKQLDPARLQSEVLDEAINQYYVKAAQEQKLRPVASPEVTVTKFVPFDTLEFTAEVEAVGDVTLPDYQHIKLDKRPVVVTAKEVTEVLDRLLIREAAKKEVQRASKDGDEVVIDFTGVDTKTKEPIQGADGNDFPLVLGSNSFIPGFEPQLVGLKAGGKKTFDITFPKDYGVAALQKREVTFSVTIKKVQAVSPPKLDDAFAAKLGPFKTVAELKADIKKQLTSERQTEAGREFENQLVSMIGEKTKVAIPSALVDDQLKKMDNDERQNLTYRGQTWEEHLKSEAVTEEEHRERQRPTAELNVKIGLALSEIAEKEGIVVSRQELDDRLTQLKSQYPDPAMRAELDKPENRQDIFNRIVTEKTLDKLLGYAQNA